MIDPQLIDHLPSEGISTAPPSSQGLRLVDGSYSSTLMGLLDNSEPIKQESGSSPSKSFTRDDRVWPTTYNPVYGLVEGAKHGSTDWSTYKKCDEHASLTCLNIRCSLPKAASSHRNRLKESCITLLLWNGGYCRTCEFSCIRNNLLLVY